MTWDLFSGAFLPTTDPQLVSNPYVTQTEPTMARDVATFDRNGRTMSLQHFSGNGLPFPWGGNGSSTGAVNTSYSSNTTTTTDEAGASRTSYVNGLPIYLLQR